MTAKTYTIRTTRRTYRGEYRDTDITGTLEQLIEHFSYTLEKGYSHQNERGNKKINKYPKTAASLVTNLNNAVTNATANGNASTRYSLI